MDQRQIIKQFKLKSLSLRPAAISRVLQHLADADEPFGALQALIGALPRLELTSDTLDHTDIERLMSLLELDQPESGPPPEAVKIIDAFDLPRVLYNPRTKVFTKVHGETPIHGNVNIRLEMMKQRLLRIRQIVLRNPHFQPPVIGHGSSQGSASRNFIQLNSIESLLGTLEAKSVLGMITKRDDQLYLEDLSGSIPIEFADTQVGPGIFTETCIVLAMGVFKDGIFMVNELFMPPSEDREASCTANGKVDVFTGDDTRPSPDAIRELYDLEKAANDRFFIMLSDVWLDRVDVMEKLKTLFDGYASSPPSLIVLFGNFTSPDISAEKDGPDRVLQAFDAFAGLISRYPSIATQSHFIFIAGPGDVNTSAVLPRAAIPRVFTKRLTRVCKNITLASNPCRIRYCTQDIVLAREDIVSKLRRSSVLSRDNSHTPSLTIGKEVSSTLIQQCHLNPVPLFSAPAFWGLDHALTLYPTPHVLVIADKFDQFEETENGCLCVNPGPFPGRWEFTAYYPSERRAEFCRIDS